MNVPLSRTRLRIWSRETGSAVQARISLLILHTQAEYGVHSRGSSRFPPASVCLNRLTSSGQSRVNRVTRLRTDGVQCRKSAGTGPVVLKVVLVTGAAILQVAMDQLMCISLSQHPLLLQFPRFPPFNYTRFNMGTIAGRLIKETRAISLF